MTKKQIVGWGFAGVVALFMLTGPHEHAQSAATSPPSEESSSSSPSDGAQPIADDGTVKGGETYDQYNQRRDALQGSAGSYGGDGCTQDCGGHQAGYEWAQAHDVDDPDDCGGNSWSFEEGCRAYATEQQSGDDKTDDSDDG